MVIFHSLILLMYCSDIADCKMYENEFMKLIGDDFE